MHALTLLRLRNFALLFFGRCISFLGNAMAPVALTFAVLSLTGSATALGFVLAARMVPNVAFLLFGGVIADRLPRNIVLVGSNLVAGASQALVAALLLSGHAEIWQIAILEAVNGTAAAIFTPADTAIVPLTVPRDRLQQANAFVRFGTNSMMIGGAVLAGVIVAAGSPGLAIALDAATFFVAAALMAAMRGIEAAALGERTSFIHDLRDGWSEFTAHRWLWSIVLQFSFMLLGVYGAFFVLGPVVMSQDYSGAASWAAILGGQSAGFLAGGLLALRWRPERPLLVATIAIFGTTLPIACMALNAPIAVIVATAFVCGIGIEIFGVYWYTAVQENVDPQALSRVSSYDHLGSQSIAPIGLVAAGPLAALIGLDQTLWLGVMLITVPTALVLFVPEVRNLRSRTQIIAVAA